MSFLFTSFGGRERCRDLSPLEFMLQQPVIAPTFVLFMIYAVTKNLSIVWQLDGPSSNPISA
jgi:hypothetical protein